MVLQWTNKQFEDFLASTDWAEENKAQHRENFEGYISISDKVIFYPTKEDIKEREYNIVDVQDKLKELGTLLLKEHVRIANTVITMDEGDKELIFYVDKLIDVFKKVVLVS